MNAPRPSPSRRSGQLQAASDRGELPLWAVLVVAAGVLALGFGGGSTGGRLGDGALSSEVAVGNVQALGDVSGDSDGAAYDGAGSAGTGSAGTGSAGTGSEALASVPNLDGSSSGRDSLQAQLGSDSASDREGARDANRSSAPKPQSQGSEQSAGGDGEARERAGSSMATDLGRQGLREDGSYREGVRHGLWRAWREDGSLRSQGAYVHGLRDGVWEAFSESGALLSLLTFEEGTRSGAWTAFSESGVVLEEGQYSGDAASGRWTTYYSGGLIKERGLFVNGLREGLWEFYDDLGQPTLQAGEYRAGIKIQ